MILDRNRASIDSFSLGSMSAWIAMAPMWSGRSHSLFFWYLAGREGGKKDIYIYITKERGHERKKRAPVLTLGWLPEERHRCSSTGRLYIRIHIILIEKEGRRDQVKFIFTPCPRPQVASAFACQQSTYSGQTGPGGGSSCSSPGDCSSRLWQHIPATARICGS